MTIKTAPPAPLPRLPVGGAPGGRASYQEPAAVTVSSSTDFSDIVDEWGEQSFPASDPPSNW